MRISPDALPANLARGPRGAYLVTGSEPLLIAEACDAIRMAVRAGEPVDREVHFLDRHFDWDALLADAANMSLFASRRLIELRLGPAPDAGASRALAGLAERPPEDSILLVSGTLERKTLTTAWVKAFDSSGVVVVTEPVGRSDLPGWIRNRLARKGVTIEAQAAELLADRVEGNLLAAQQAIERIALLMPDGTPSAAQVAELIADSARFDVFELSTAAFAGQPQRALRVLAGLRAEGREPPLVLWALLQDLRGLSRVVQRAGQERSIDAIMRAEGIWASRQGPLRAALPRLSRSDIDALLVAAASADRMAKGQLRGDAWVAIESIVARIAGLALAA